MASIKIDPAVKAALKLTSDDASAFAIAMFRQASAPMRQLQNRVCHRAGLSIVEVADSDPQAPGAQRARIDLRASGSDGPDILGAKFAALAMRGQAAQTLILDEGRRIALGMPEGPKSKALDESRSLDGDAAEADELVSDATLHLLGGARSFDPVITPAILMTVGLPILLAILPTVLGVLVELGKKAFEVVTGQSAPKAAPAGGAKSSGGSADPGGLSGYADDLADAVGIGKAGKDDSAMGLVLVAVIVGAYLYLRKKGG